jgi:hypothetical protein
MDEGTVAFHDEHATELSACLESVDMSHLHSMLAMYLPRSSAVFEIGREGDAGLSDGEVQFSAHHAGVAWE